MEKSARNEYHNNDNVKEALAVLSTMQGLICDNRGRLDLDPNGLYCLLGCAVNRLEQALE